MKCRETRKILSRYLDHELSSTETGSVEQHLAQCPECRAEHATQQRIWTMLASVEPIRTPDLVAGIDARLSEPRGWASFVARLQLRSLGYAAATAGLLGLFVWLGIWAGTARRDSSADERDRAFAELLSDAPPGMEVVVVLDQLGERP